MNTNYTFVSFVDGKRMEFVTQPTHNYYTEIQNKSQYVLQ